MRTHTKEDIRQERHAGSRRAVSLTSQNGAIWFFCALVAALLLVGGDVTAAESNGLTVNLNKTDLSKKTDNKVTAKLNSTLLTFVKIAKVSYGLKNVEIGKDFRLNPNGSYTFQFDDPLKKISKTVTIPALSKTIIKRKDHFHERFLFLCALETACYHGGSSYKTASRLAPYSYCSYSFRATNVAMYSSAMSALNGLFVRSKLYKDKIEELKNKKFNQIAIDNVQSRLDKLDDRNTRVLKEMISGAFKDPFLSAFPTRVKFDARLGNSIDDGMDFIARLGISCQNVFVEPEPKGKISLEDVESFVNLMSSPRDFPFKFQSLDYDAEVRIHVDPVSSARMQSYQRVYKYVTGKNAIPKLYGVVPDFKRAPEFAVKQDKQSDAVFIPSWHVIYESGRVADRTTSGMLARKDVYHQEDFAKKGIDYYPHSKFDFGVALTSAYFFAAGFEGDLKKVIPEDELKNLSVRFMNDASLAQFTKGKVHFEAVTQVEVDRANDEPLTRSQKTVLEEQRVKEGRPWYQAQQELKKEEEQWQANRRMSQE